MTTECLVNLKLLMLFVCVFAVGCGAHRCIKEITCNETPLRYENKARVRRAFYIHPETKAPLGISTDKIEENAVYVFDFEERSEHIERLYKLAESAPPGDITDIDVRMKIELTDGKALYITKKGEVLSSSGEKRKIEDRDVPYYEAIAVGYEPEHPRKPPDCHVGITWVKNPPFNARYLEKVERCDPLSWHIQDMVDEEYHRLVYEEGKNAETEAENYDVIEERLINEYKKDCLKNRK